MDEEKVVETSAEVAETVEESVMSVESLREAYASKNAELKEKYKDLITAISIKQDKDLGVAFDMLKAVGRGGDEYLEGIEVEFNKEELLKDLREAMELAVKIADGE